MASCKPFQVEFSVSAEVLYKKIVDLIDNHSGSIQGDHTAGSFSVPVSSFGRVEGNYSITDSAICLTITKRPRLLACAVIESFFRKNLPKLEAANH